MCVERIVCISVVFLRHNVVLFTLATTSDLVTGHVVTFIYYRQHCTQRKAPIYKLFRGLSWGFSPRRGDTLHRWSKIWHGGPLLHAKFHRHQCNNKGI